MKVYVVMWYDEAVDNCGIVGVYASLKKAEEVKKQKQECFGCEFSIEVYDLKEEENKSMENRTLVQFYDSNNEAYPFLMAITQDQMKILNWLEGHEMIDGGFSIMSIEEP